MSGPFRRIAAYVMFAGAVVVVVAAGPAGPPGQEERTFGHPACQIAFRHPVDWAVHHDSTHYSGPCVFMVRPLAWDSLLVEADSVASTYTIWVQVFPSSFDSALTESPFERRDGAWIVYGRHGLESPATAIASRRWHGVRGTSTVGCHRIQGGYVGLCHMHNAFIGTDTRSVVLQTSTAVDEVFERMLATLEIEP